MTECSSGGVALHIFATIGLAGTIVGIWYLLVKGFVRAYNFNEEFKELKEKVSKLERKQ